MFQAIIFDMDGVLVNSEHLKAKAWKKILERYGVSDGDKWYKARVGTVRLELCRQAISEFNLPAQPKELFDLKRETYRELSAVEPQPIKSSIRFLKSIPRDRIKIGLASSTDRDIIVQQLKMIGVLNYFDAIASGESDGVKNKPHPGLYLLAAERLGVLPLNCIGVEDTSVGVESVKNAGMKCIAYRNPDSSCQDFSLADMVTDDLSKLTLSKLYDFWN